MPSLNLPNKDHVLRYAPPRDLRKSIDENENEVVIGLLPDAFRRKTEHKNLSVTWVERFSGSYCEQIKFAVQAFRTTFKSASKTPYKGAFGIGGVAAIKQAAERHRHKIRILHDPQPTNDGHSEIHRLPRDEDELLEILATQVFVEFVLNLDIP
jgi:hypothetical protein